MEVMEKVTSTFLVT